MAVPRAKRRLACPKAHIEATHRKTFGAVLLASSALWTLQAQLQWVVPPDESLVIEEYVRLGIPEPQRPWSLDEHDQALDTLGRLQRAQLPRYGSDRSGVLFERLLASEVARGGQLMASVRSADEFIERIRTGQRLYAPAAEDHFLFDRELLDFITISVRDEVQSLPNVAEQVERLSTWALELDSKSERAKVSDLIRRAREVQHFSEALLYRGLSELIALGAPEATRDRTREALRERLEELIPQAADFLSQEHAVSVHEALGEIAALDWNKEIRPGLLALAESVSLDP